MLKRLQAIIAYAQATRRVYGMRRMFRVGFRVLRRGMRALVPITVSNEDYAAWIAENEAGLANAKPAPVPTGTVNSAPQFSVVVPVYNVSATFLRVCIESVQHQTLGDWELILYDDASTLPETTETLREFENIDPRIKVFYGTQNLHISGATNAALTHATGTFVALLDCDDTYAPHALETFAAAIAVNPDADVFYSDEDRIDEHDTRSQPFFKPAWSEQLLLSTNYITHLLCVRRSAGDAVGWLRHETRGAQDHDLCLRVFAHSQKPFVHVPAMLYHWRMHEGSSAGNPFAKNYARTSGLRALTDYATQQHLAVASISGGVARTQYRIRYASPSTPYAIVVIDQHDAANALHRAAKWLKHENLPVPMEIVVAESVVDGLRKTSAQLLLFVEPSMIRSVDRGSMYELLSVADHAHVQAVSATFVSSAGTIVYAGEQEPSAQPSSLGQYPETGYYRLTLSRYPVTGISSYLFAAKRPAVTGLLQDSSSNKHTTTSNTLPELIVSGDAIAVASATAQHAFTQGESSVLNATSHNHA